jgi:hypothetical protein
MSRPNTFYHPLTWKENIDAFNRRLRRGSLSFDGNAQDEEQFFTPLTNAQSPSGEQGILA